MYVEVGWLIAVAVVALIGGMFIGRSEERRRAEPLERRLALDAAEDEWKRMRDSVVSENNGTEDERTRRIANVLRERTYALLLSDVVVLPYGVREIVEETARWTRKAELIEYARKSRESE